ncbi:MAG: polyphosphate:AMP phosphotransferase [Alphaproteobacteria bacterium]|nr:polyphosphate:AMP phosphotransferase [Alphaproteobacteria bacterium]
MFETAELGRKVGKKDFEAAENELRTALLEAQRALAGTRTSVVVVVSGVEGAGKGDLVNRLTAWLDPRGTTTHAFWDTTDEERERPWWWRFWRTLPRRGTIGVLFGSWYTEPIVDEALDRSEPGVFERRLREIEAFESMLAADGTLFLKVWMHLSKDAQRERWRADAAKGRAWRESPLAEEYGARYDAFLATSERAIRHTDTGRAPWYIVEAADARWRDLTVGRTLLKALQERLQGETGPSVAQTPTTLDPPGKRATVLDSVPLDRKLDRDTYKAQLDHWQTELNRLSWAANAARRSTVVVFEGWDAAGKGGAIRRITGAVDARLSQIIPVAAPTDEEAAQHYLWRFWRHVPRAGRLTIYDRSWYGRVLVERVEGFARDDEWLRAYHEINAFEGELLDHGITICKLWLHIDRDEQLRRFEERRETPWKMHKITDEDWRNRKRWKPYAAAVHDMVQHTSTARAPWTLVAANDKRYARIQVLETVCRAIAGGLGEPVAEPPVTDPA